MVIVKPDCFNLLTHVNLEASLHSLLSFEWALTRPKNSLRQNIVFSYSEMIPVSFFLSFFFVFMLCYVIYFAIINFCKNCFLSIVLLLLIIIIYYYYYKYYYLIN